MELLHELLLTALVAVLFSYLVAKLVSFAMAPAADSASSADLKDVDEALVMEELRYRENLNVGALESKNRVEFVEQNLEKVEKFQEVQPVEEISEQVSRDEEIETESRHQLLEESPAEVIEAEPCTESSEEKTKEDSVTSVTKMIVNKRVEETAGESEMKGDVIAEESEGIGESKDELVIDEDEEWEGIERSELEKVFGAAVKLVESGDKDDLVSDVQMDLYGLHKVATEGPCREPQPMAFMVSARAKWNAWQKLGNMSPEEAMEQYVAILSDRVPGWMEENCSGDGKLESQEAGKPDAGAPDLRSSLGHQTNYTHERNTELKRGSEAGDLTGGTSLETGANDKYCLAA